MVTADNRITAWSGQLTQAHDTLRRHLRLIQEGLGSPKAEGPTLITHCLALRVALTTHHVGEDDGMFLELLRTRADLERDCPGFG